MQKDRPAIGCGPVRRPRNGSPPAGALVKRDGAGPLCGGDFRLEADTAVGRPCARMLEQSCAEALSAGVGDDEQAGYRGRARVFGLSTPGTDASSHSPNRLGSSGAGRARSRPGSHEVEPGSTCSRQSPTPKGTSRVGCRACPVGGRVLMNPLTSVVSNVDARRKLIPLSRCRRWRLITRGGVHDSAYV